MKKAIIFYSYSGNTKRIAERIHSVVGGDIFEVKTKVKYPEDYDTVVEIGKKEVESGYKPEIEKSDVDLKNYDEIYLGTPVWWYTFAPAMKTFIESADFTGKTVYPFATNGGWIGRTFKDFEKECKGATVKNGLNVRFDDDTLVTSVRKIDEWAEKTK